MLARKNLIASLLVLVFAFWAPHGAAEPYLESTDGGEATSVPPLQQIQWVAGLWVECDDGLAALEARTGHAEVASSRADVVVGVSPEDFSFEWPQCVEAGQFQWVANLSVALSVPADAQAMAHAVESLTVNVTVDAGVVGPANSATLARSWSTASDLMLTATSGGDVAYEDGAAQIPIRFSTGNTAQTVDAFLVEGQGVLGGDTVVLDAFDTQTIVFSYAPVVEETVVIQLEATDDVTGEPLPVRTLTLQMAGLEEPDDKDSPMASAAVLLGLLGAACVVRFRRLV